MKSGLKNSTIITIGNALVALLALILFASSALAVLSNALFDMDLTTSRSHQPHEDIVVVAIDQESIKSVGTFPWDRKIYAQMISTLEKGNPKVLAFDIMMDTNSNNADSDKALADELAKHNNIVLPSHAQLEGAFDRSTKVKEGEIISAGKIEQPIPMFAKSVQKAHINAAFDQDGVIRRNWLQINTPEGVFPSLGYKVAEMAGADVSSYLNLPVQPNRPKSELIIRWDANEFDFETISFSKVISGQVPVSTFKDRIVLVGMTTPGSDEGITPIEQHMHLVYAHANIASQLLKSQKVTFASGWIPLLLAAIVIAVIGWLTWRIKAIAGVIVVFAATLVLAVGQYFIFKFGSVYVDVVNVMVGGLISYFVNISIKTFFETKQKNYITKQFGRYISPDLVKEIANSGQEIQLGGISKELTILFLDVRGFTPLSEKLKPDEVVGFLNMMFDLITERALVNHGTIDKFIGDAAMILYNAPLDVPNHPYFAVKTAYEIQKGMEKVRADVLEKYGVVISVGIGINTGDVVVGNIGSYLRVDYTAIGDNVNTAARIESNTNPNQVLVSEVTYELTKEYFEYNYAGEKLMKGKSIPLKLFEVTGIKGAPSDAAERTDAKLPERAS
jgi:adenylate cyclase